MTEEQQKELGKILWSIADRLRGAMNPDSFRDYMLSFLFLRYLSDNYEEAAKKELRKEYEPLQIWYKKNKKDIPAFEKQMRKKAHYVIAPQYLWGSIVEMARQDRKSVV